MPPTFCFSAKEGQLVQVMVSSYTCPTFVLSVAVVLLVVLLLKRSSRSFVLKKAVLTSSTFQISALFSHLQCALKRVYCNALY